ncbi:MAG: ATP-binding cassette domain-containing protein [Candidatus Bathyarchaeota archaeon]
MLEVKNLVVKVEDRIILNGVSISLKKSENYIMFGPNGSGKTTLINAIMGMPPFEVVSGRIVFMGEDITKKFI